MLDSRRPIVTINLTPLVDVSLVLVVIFMATAPMFMQSGIIVTSGENKDKAATAAPAKPEETILIKLEGDGVWLNQRPVTLAELTPLLKGVLASSQSKRVIVNPSREVRHGRVVAVMDLAKQAGAENIIILGKTQETGPAPAGK
jgi:biopolymer transport protein ExbD